MGCENLSDTPAEAYRDRRILVTGASGFIGSNLVSRLLPVECSIDRLSRSQLDSLPRSQAEVTDLTGDLKEPSVWERVLPGIDVIFHLAAQTSSATSEENPALDLEANVLPMLGLLTVCRDRGYDPTIIFAGTVTQVGVTREVPVDESLPDNPTTVYDLHKLTAEAYLAFFSRSARITGATLRLPNIYGPGPTSSRPDRGILNAMIRRALKGETLLLYGGGQHSRDYLYIDDTINAFLLAGIAGHRMQGDHFVLGTGKGTTLCDAFTMVADCVGEKTGNRVAVEHVDPPSPLSPIEARDFVADPSAFRTAVGWEDPVDLRTGINRTIEAFS